MDAATDIDGEATPTPGDYSLCINCATVLVFDDRLHLAVPTHQQMQEATAEVWRAQQAVKQVAKVEPRYQRLPCGCIHGTEDVNGTRTYVFEPHALDCKYYLYVQDEMARQGKPVTVVDAR